MKRRRTLRLILGFSFAAAFAVPRSAAAPRSAPILFLTGQNGSRRAADTVAAFTEAWEKKEGGVRVLSQFFAIYSFPPSREAIAASMESIERRLGADPPRLIAAEGDFALDLAVALRNRAFPDCAIVGFEVLQGTALRYAGERRMSLLPFTNFAKENVEIARRVLPGLKTVYVLLSPGPLESEGAGLAETFPGIDFRYVINPTMESADRALSGAKGDAAAICFTPGWRDETGRFVSGTEFFGQLTRRYYLPVFSHAREDLEAGLAGGFGLSKADWGTAAALTGLDLLAKKENAPYLVSPRSFARTYLNYGALSRFGVALRGVPLAIEVIDRPEPAWNRFRLPIQAAVLTMALILITLAVSFAVRRRVDIALRWANEKLERQVEQRTKELSVANQELETSNEHLATALRRTEAMQEAMLKSARESVLGRLAASLANELNSPLNAIASANDSSQSVLKDGKDSLGARLTALDPAQRELFDRYAKKIMTARYAKSDRDYEAVGKLEAVLRAAAGPGAAADAAAETAADLVDCGLDLLPQEELAAFADPRSRPVADALYRLSVIFRSGHVISSAVQTATAAVAEVRAYSDSMVARNDQTDFDLGASVGKALTLLRDKLGGPYAVTAKLPKKAVVRGDEAAFIRVWTHLLQNALEAMPDGGRLEIELRIEAEECRVSIADTGTGVEAAIRDRVFDSFVTTKGDAEGLGLGLSYCKRVVQGAGGTIRYETGETGTVFIVTLPRERNPV